MIGKDAINILKGIQQENLEENDFLGKCAIDMAIEVLKETERNPTITSWYDFDRGYEKGKAAARHHGEWKWKETCRDEHFRYGDIYCGCCGYVRHQAKPQLCLNVALFRHPVCENCGADMRKKEGEQID